MKKNLKFYPLIGVLFWIGINNASERGYHFENFVPGSDSHTTYGMSTGKSKPKDDDSLDLKKQIREEVSRFFDEIIDEKELPVIYRMSGDKVEFTSTNFVPKSRLDQSFIKLGFEHKDQKGNIIPFILSVRKDNLNSLHHMGGIPSIYPEFQFWSAIINKRNDGDYDVAFIDTLEEIIADPLESLEAYVERQCEIDKLEAEELLTLSLGGYIQRHKKIQEKIQEIDNLALDISPLHIRLPCRLIRTSKNFEENFESYKERFHICKNRLGSNFTLPKFEMQFEFLGDLVFWNSINFNYAHEDEFLFLALSSSGGLKEIDIGPTKLHPILKKERIAIIHYHATYELEFNLDLTNFRSKILPIGIGEEYRLDGDFRSRKLSMLKTGDREFFIRVVDDRYGDDYDCHTDDKGYVALQFGK